MNQEDLTPAQAEFLKSMTPLFWWQKPPELLLRPERTLAGIMDRGSVEQWRDLEKLFPREAIIEAIETAQCGEFHNWTWKFWRLRYDLDPEKPLPPRLPGWPSPSGDYWHKDLQVRQAPADPSDLRARLAWAFEVRENDGN